MPTPELKITRTASQIEVSAELMEGFNILLFSAGRTKGFTLAKVMMQSDIADAYISAVEVDGGEVINEEKTRALFEGATVVSHVETLAEDDTRRYYARFDSLYNEYVSAVEADGGEVISEEKTKDLFNFRQFNNSRVIVSVGTNDVLR